MSGLTQVMGYEDGEVRNSATALNDPMTGTHAAAAVAEALRRRRRTGQGERVELTLHGSGVAFSGPWLIAHQLGEPLAPLGNGHPDMSPHGVFRCAGDDAWLAIACEDDAAWGRLADLIGADSRLDLAQRRAASADIDRHITAWTRQRDKHAACAELQAAGVAAGPVNAAADMLADAQASARGYFDFAEPTGERMPGNPVTMTGLDSARWRPCPRLGEDNASVLLDWLGMSGEDVRQLAGSGVLHDAPPA
jgi:crotonobetainyl-CoA:carnitine CoA-transferase CaiB-like acyl-CoA transferase